jgi:S-adenosylmethionine synthetase
MEIGPTSISDENDRVIGVSYETITASCAVSTGNSAVGIGSLVIGIVTTRSYASLLAASGSRL